MNTVDLTPLQRSPNDSRTLALIAQFVFIPGFAAIGLLLCGLAALGAAGCHPYLIIGLDTDLSLPERQLRDVGLYVEDGVFWLHCDELAPDRHDPSRPRGTTRAKDWLGFAFHESYEGSLGPGQRIGVHGGLILALIVAVLVFPLLRSLGNPGVTRRNAVQALRRWLIAAIGWSAVILAIACPLVYYGGHVAALACYGPDRPDVIERAQLDTIGIYLNGSLLHFGVSAAVPAADATSDVHRNGMIVPGLLSWETDVSTVNQSHAYVLSAKAWVVALLLGIAPATAMRRALLRNRRIRAGRCAHCGYDLRGSAVGRCSECGTPTISRSANR